MVCIYCTSSTNVTNSRHQVRTNTIWRRRTCISCGAVTSTRETYSLEGSLLYLASPSSNATPFIREKLFVSIYESCRHRPAAISDAIGLTETILGLCMKAQNPTGTVRRKDLIHIACGVLTRFDPVASTYYAAYHKL